MLLWTMKVLLRRAAETGEGEMHEGMGKAQDLLGGHFFSEKAECCKENLGDFDAGRTGKEVTCTREEMC